MATSPRMRWPYPSEGVDPWYDSFSGMVDAQDTTAFSAQEAKNIILSGGGIISWTASTGLLQWASPLEVNAASTGFLESIPAGSVYLPNDGDVGYVRFLSGPSASLELVVRVSGALPAADLDRALVLFRRRGNRVFFRNGGVIQDGESAAIIDVGTTGVATLDYEIRNSAVGSAPILNFAGPLAVSGAIASGQANIEFQLAADAVEVTVSPYTLNPGYRAFYVNRASPTTVNLPAAYTLANQLVIFKTFTSAGLLLLPNGSETIDGAVSLSLNTSMDSVILHATTLDGVNWLWLKAAGTTGGAGGGGSGSTFTLVRVEPLVAGNAVAVNGAGQAILADSTVAGRYPAIGVCVSVVGPTTVIQTGGSATAFSGLTIGQTYYLGASGALATAPPMGASVSQPLLRAYSATSGVVLAESNPIYL